MTNVPRTASGDPAVRAPVCVITRDDGADDRLASALAENGFRVLRLPLLETAPGPDVATLETRLATLEPGTAIAWTSARAAAALAEAAGPRHLAALRRVPLFTLGGRSAAPIRRLDVAVTTPSAEGASARGLAVSIAALAETGTIRRVLYLAGNRSLPDFTEALAARAIPFERLVVYETRLRRPDSAALLRALREEAVACLVVMSPSAAEALDATLPPDLRDSIRSLPVAAKGPTTAAALRARGFRAVVSDWRARSDRASDPPAFLALRLMAEVLS